jgi:hypothetical protein
MDHHRVPMCIEHRVPMCIEVASDSREPSSRRPEPQLAIRASQHSAAALFVSTAW